MTRKVGRRTRAPNATGANAVKSTTLKPRDNGRENSTTTVGESLASSMLSCCSPSRAETNRSGVSILRWSLGIGSVTLRARRALSSKPASVN